RRPNSRGDLNLTVRNDRCPDYQDCGPRGDIPPPDWHQKIYFAPSWTMRPGPAAEIVPKLAFEEKLADGLAKLTRLGILNASKRSWTFPQRSEIGMDLNKLISMLIVPGPIKVLRPRLPKVPIG